jgi:hypothetical protein
MHAKDCCDKVMTGERHFSLCEIPTGTSGAQTLYVTCRGQAGNHAHVRPQFSLTAVRVTIRLKEYTAPYIYRK